MNFEKIMGIGEQTIREGHVQDPVALQKKLDELKMRWDAICSMSSTKQVKKLLHCSSVVMELSCLSYESLFCESRKKRPDNLFTVPFSLYHAVKRLPLLQVLGVVSQGYRWKEIPVSASNGVCLP